MFSILLIYRVIRNQEQLAIFFPSLVLPLLLFFTRHSFLGVCFGVIIFLQRPPWAAGCLSVLRVIIIISIEKKTFNITKNLR